MALAVLPSFVLAPLVRLLQRLVPRSVAVIVIFALAASASLAMMVMIEVNQFANDLPATSQLSMIRCTTCGTPLVALRRRQQSARSASARRTGGRTNRQLQ